ncbi:MAG: dihydrofolate reductase [Bacteroidales bacterium]|nr:dihydrofolate reductase [Bacteroidales bacterium]
MSLTIIVAIARDGAIGHAGDLLWHLRADLRHFKEKTMGGAVIMGRRTWESLPKGALPGRRNIVITRQEGFTAPGATVCSDLPAAIEAAGGLEAYIIGGAQVYNQALPLADRLELTRVERDYPQADTRMPDPAAAPGWQLTAATEPQTDEREGLTFHFETYTRESSNPQ